MKFQRALLTAPIVILFIFIPQITIAKEAPVSPHPQTAAKYIPPQPNARPALARKQSALGVTARQYYPSFKSNYRNPEQIASAYIALNKADIGISDPNSDLRLMQNQRSLAAWHYRYQQYWQGIPVFGSQVVVNVTNAGEISSVLSDCKSDLSVATRPQITSENALQTAIGDIGASAFRDTAQKELVIYSNDEIAPTLCWKVLVMAEKPLGDWQIFVDAINGNVVYKQNIICFIDGAGFSFDPNPSVSQQNLALADSSDRNYQALTDARHNVVLRDLNPQQNGYYYLSGPYVNTGPTRNRAHHVTPDSFYYNRQDDRFEEVNVYYQIDACARYYQSLGFDNIMTYSISVNVNGTTDDNSWFSPGQLQITYGSGGVDDAEDGDVIIHEYGHATQYNQVPGWGMTHEGGSMGEGFGDYLAVGFFHHISGGWREAQVFDWDANPRDGFWDGRRVDSNKHYPEDMHNEVHDDGEIWSRCLWDIQNAIGADTALQLVLESHFYLTPYANFEDGANAIVQADLNLYSGAHVMAIGQAFVDRGILSELPIQLILQHTNLNDTEDLTGPYNLMVNVTHTNELDSVIAYYRIGDAPEFQAVEMIPDGNPGEMIADIPGAGQPSTVRYYFRAIDGMGLTSILPPDAPANTFSFYAGPDTIAPQITHTPLQDYPDMNWPPILSAQASDNIGVDSVFLEYQINGGVMQTAPMVFSDSLGTWSGAPDGQVVGGDVVQYRIRARDRSSNGNEAYLPSDGYYAFNVLTMITMTYYSDGFAIPDAGHAGILDTITISDRMRIFAIDVFVDIDHPRIGDLYFFFRGPRGRQVTLHNQNGGDGDSIVGWYDDELIPDGPGSMIQYEGDSSQANWLFYIADRVAGETGTLNRWGIRIVGAGSPVAVGENAKLPSEFTLDQNYPNPFNPSTNISFSLSTPSDVRLEIFDLLGRHVTTLLNANLGSGPHTVSWNGCNECGEPASSGIYFARLIADDKSSTVRMSLIR